MGHELVWARAELRDGWFPGVVWKYGSMCHHEMARKVAGYECVRPLGAEGGGTSRAYAAAGS